MLTFRILRRSRQGGVYIAVLGTALIVSVLGLTAILLGRVQNRILTESADIRQAQLNAESAVELALLSIAQDGAWRANRSNGRWFTKKDTGSGSASVDVIDPVDGNLGNDPDQAIFLRAFGYRGALSGNAPRTEADQRIELMVDPIRDPLDCLRQGMQSQDFPDWNAVFDYFQAHGTAIDIDNLSGPQLARNRQLEFAELAPAWTGVISDFPDADIDRIGGANPYLMVSDRDSSGAGAAQFVGEFIKPNTTYTASVRVRVGLLDSNRYRVSFYARPDVRVTSSNGVVLNLDPWRPLTVEFTVPNWTPAALANAFVIVHSESGDRSFDVDELRIVENTSDKYIYRHLLSPAHNPFGGAPNPNGLYWIDCEGHNLVIERSRILGTLLVRNPGPASRVQGSVDWSPYLPGYPALVVQNNFAIRITNAPLQEDRNVMNYNPAGAAHDLFGEDNIRDDPYPSEIRGLIAVSGNLVYENNPTIRGQVVGGGTVTGTSNFVYQPDSLLSPPPGFYNYRYERRPGSIKKAVRH